MSRGSRDEERGRGRRSPIAGGLADAANIAANQLPSGKMNEISRRDLCVDGFNGNQLQTERNEEEQTRRAEEACRAAPWGETGSRAASWGLEREVSSRSPWIWPRPWRSMSSRRG